MAVTNVTVVPGKPREEHNLRNGATIREALKEKGIDIPSGYEVRLNNKPVDPDKTQIYDPFMGRDEIEIAKKDDSGQQPKGPGTGTGAGSGSGSGGQKKQDIKIMPKDKGYMIP